MRIIPLLLLVLYITFDIAASAAVIALDRRQDTEAVTISASSTEPPASTTLATSSFASGGSETTTTSATATETHTAASSSITTSTASTTSAAQNSTSSAGNADEQDANHLPFQPKITPALGVAGVVLMILGGVYSLIGIKNQWVHVFLSAAFLASLGVTVLIIYVMNPPVRNTIQGAYFVAAFLTGLAFGGLSLVFKEITEGLGCILGGFCLSMWLLCLQPGGLLISAGTKGALIGALSAGAYVLSLFRHTRPYGLMGSTAFAGATAVVLGIDCFSRVGLKEFWLYIWDLNDDIFPLSTTSYPVTRGIRVELAVIMIICVLGVISQLKLWKVIKERRERQQKLEKEERKKNEETETEMARKLEEGTMRERAQWEAMYGNKEAQQSESGIGTEVPDDSKKYDTTVEMAEVEQSDETASKYSSRPADHSNKLLQRDREDQMDEGSPLVSQTHEDPQKEHRDNVPVLPKDLPRTTMPTQTVMPPGFKVPDAVISPKDDERSVAATFAGSEPLSPRRSRSGHSLLGRPSQGSSAHMTAPSEEALISPYSQASSVAARLDDVIEIQSEKQSLSMKNDGNDANCGPTTVESITGEHPDSHLPKKSQQDSSEEMTKEDTKTQDESETGLSVNTEKIPKLSIKTGQEETCSSPSAADVLPAREIFSLLPVTSPPPRSSEQTESIPPYDAYDAPSEYSRDKKAPSLKEKSQTSTSMRAALTADAVQTLPDRGSKIVVSYRTNEWTKHLAEAEPPELDPIEPEDREGDNGDGGSLPEEPAAPVNIDELQQTALNAQPPPFVHRRASVADRPSAPMYKRAVSNVSGLPQEESPKSNPTVKKKPKRLSQASAGSSPNLLQSPSASPQIGSSRRIRSISNPLLSNSLAAAPIHESEEADFQETPRAGSQPLIAVREDIMRNRVSSTSLLPYDSRIERSNSRISLGGPQSPLQGSQSNLLDDDDIPLAQRRAFIQRQSLNRRSSSGAALTATPFDSYQSLQRQQSTASNTRRNEATVTAWRESVRGDTNFPPSNTNFYRSGRLEQHQSWQEKHEQERAASYIDNAVAEGMQRGELRELHLKAMRRLQAAANRHI